MGALDLREVLIFLATVAVSLPLCARLRINPVLAFLVSGVAVGPHALGLIRDVSGARALGELGVVFLLFGIGLELSVERLFVLRRHAFGLGTAQVLATAAVIGAGAYAFSGQPALSAVVGVTLALSSTAVALRVLADRHELSTSFGRAALAVLLLQDLAVVPLLVILPALGGDAGALLPAVGLALLKAALALAAIVVFGRFLLRPLIRLAAASRLKEAFAATALLVVLGTAFATEAAGLSLALGAFLAGVAVAETEFRHQIEADIQPFYGLLIGIFFTAVGMSLDLRFALERFGAVLGLAALLILAKAAIAGLLARAFGLTLREAVRTGLLLSQAGEFGFILLALAETHVGLAPETAQLLKVVVAASMATTPAMAVAGQRLAELLGTRDPDRVAPLAAEVEGLKDHVIVAGFGRVGQTVAKLLRAKNVPVIALDLDSARIREGRAAGYRVYYGEAGSPYVMRAAGAGRARAVVVTLDHAERARRAVALLAREYPALPVIVRARDNRHREQLRAAGASAIVPEVLEGSLSLGATVLRAVGIGDADTRILIDDFRRADYASLEELIPASGASGNGDSGGGAAASAEAAPDPDTPAPGLTGPGRRL